MTLARSLALTLLLAPAPALAATTGVLRWSGTVVGELVLEIRGDEVTRQGDREISGYDGRDDRVSLSEPLPLRECAVYARTLRGRALVAVDEQPGAFNDYTVTVVIESQRRTAEPVEIELLWLSDPPGTVGGRGRSYGGYGGYGGYGRPDPAPAPQPEYRRPTTGPSGRPLDRLRWRGRVDGSDYIDLKGDAVSVRHLTNLPVQAMDYNVSAPLPAAPIDLELFKVEGRGNVKLVAEPSAGNGWTATVLVDDRDDRGAGDYEFELVWERPRGVRIAAGGKPLEVVKWSGHVDGSDILVVHGREVTIEHLSGRPIRGAQATFTAPLPARAVSVNLVKIDGRGRAVIEAQPAASNDHTLRVRLEDSKGGEDFYRIELSWEK